MPQSYGVTLMFIIAVVGSKKSGKTTTIEALVKGLAERGYRVATAKHVSETGFTLDVKGKDTWRHAEAGATTIVVVAPEELGIIKKGTTASLGLREIVAYCQDEADVTVLEGFSSLVGRAMNVPKIVAVKTDQEAATASARFTPIIALTGPAALTAKGLDLPAVDVLKDPQKLVGIALSHLHGA